jgi:hypothetical protein
MALFASCFDAGCAREGDGCGLADAAGFESRRTQFSNGNTLTLCT